MAMVSDTQHTRSTRGSEHPPLITPSASPPPPSSSAQVYATSPHKRPRWTSVSRSSSVRLSSGANGSDIDIQKEREASRVRLLDTWSQLAERYTRRFDEDDIVDIRTGEIIKDNGFWRNNPTFTFGQALVSGETGDDEGGEEAEEVSEDDGSDELDAFSEGHDVLGDTFARNRLTGTQGSSDADDLQEFLEAEEHRKEEFGSDLDGELDSSQIPDKDTAEGTDFEDDDYDEDEVGSSNYDQLDRNSPTYESAPEEFVSDDELDNWELTEASIVVVAAGAREHSREDSESEVEIAKPPAPRKEPFLPGKKNNPPTQLYTPPRSHSSTDPPNSDPVYLSSPALSLIPVPSPSPPGASSEGIKSVPPVLPTKSRLQGPQAKCQGRRTAPQAVIEISDDSDDDDGRGPGSSLPPRPSPVQGPNHSIVPEVVIPTLPPQWGLDKDKNRTASSSASKSSHFKASDEKESSHKVKSQSAMQGSPKVVRLTKSLQPKEDQTAPRQRTSGRAIRKTSPEICEPPLLPALRTQKPPKSRTDGPPKKSNHKRKRSSSEHGAHSLLPQALLGDKERGKVSPPSRGTTSRMSGTGRQPTISHNSRSRSKPTVPSDDSHSSSSDEGHNHRRHASRRFPSTPASSITRRAYTPHSIPAYHSDLYPSAADPRAQQIITQAMQQLATLLWSPAHPNPPNSLYHPFTPTHNRFASVGPSFVHPTPNHPHPYPYTFDPSMSMATIPPDSPEPPSSPFKPRERQRSLVTRGRSRGRKVSFHLERADGDRSESDISRSPPSEPPSSPAKHKTDKPVKVQNSKRPKTKSKGKGKAVVQVVSDFESELDQDYHSEDKILQPIPIVSERAQPPRRPRGQGTLASTSYLRSSKCPQPGEYSSD